MQHWPRPHPDFGGPTAGSAELVIGIQLTLSHKDTDFAPDDPLKLHECACSRIAVFHPNDGGVFADFSKGRHRKRESMVFRIMIDNDVQGGKDPCNVTVKLNHICHRRHLIVRNPQQDPVGPGILDKFHFLNHFAWVWTRAPDKQGNTLFDRIDGGRGKGLKFIPQDVIAFAIGPSGGNGVHSVPDDPVHAVFQVVDRNRFPGTHIHCIGCGESRHHSKDAAQIFRRQHDIPP